MRGAHLIILGGFAGAGKTTIARKLSAHHHMPLICTDELNDALRESLGFEFKEASPHAHDLAWFLVDQYLANNVTVILDTNMCCERTWTNVDALRARMSDAHIHTFILECSLETHRERIKHRGETDKGHLNLGGDAFEDILYKYEYINNLSRPDLIRINANGTVHSVYRNVVSKLSEVQVL